MICPDPEAAGTALDPLLEEVWPERLGEGIRPEDLPAFRGSPARSSASASGSAQLAHSGSESTYDISTFSGGHTSLLSRGEGARLIGVSQPQLASASLAEFPGARYLDVQDLEIIDIFHRIPRSAICSSLFCSRLSESQVLKLSK